MRQRDTAVDEEDGETRQRQKPGKDVSAIRGKVNEGQAAEEEL